MRTWPRKTFFAQLRDLFFDLADPSHDSFAAWFLSCTVLIRARLPVSYLVTHECVDARLIPSSADAEFSERSSLFS